MLVGARTAGERAFPLGRHPVGDAARAPRRPRLEPFAPEPFAATVAFVAGEVAAVCAGLDR